MIGERLKPADRVFDMSSVNRLERDEICVLNGAIDDIETIILFEEVFDKYEVSLSVPLAQRFLLTIEDSCVFGSDCPFYLAFVYTSVPEFLVLAFA